MSTTLLEKKFSEMGARVKLRPIEQRTARGLDGKVFLDVKRDSEGEYFDIQTSDLSDLSIVDVQKKDRHLLLMGRDENKKPLKFLCGHDERHWFCAAVPGSPNTVFQAKEKLKPAELRNLEAGNIKSKNVHKRVRKLMDGRRVLRQGEFMFIPQPNFKIDEKNPLTIIHKNERLSQRGNPHIAQYLYRVGGTNVYVRGSQVLTLEAYNRLSKNDKIGWRSANQDAIPYVKGKVSHPEHTTIYLGDVWHKVVVNTESQAPGGKAVKFVD